MSVGQTLDLAQRSGGANASRYRFDFDNGVLFSVKAPRLELKVTAGDSIGNSSSATAVPRFK